jgi:hypothetical protein
VQEQVGQYVVLSDSVSPALQLSINPSLDNPSYNIGDVVHKGGLHGRRFKTCNLTFSCGKSSVTYCGFVWGGWGGAAGPNGPGRNGASAFTVGNFQTCVTYFPGAGGGANGGTDAFLENAGRSGWNTLSQGAGGGGPISTTTFYAGSIDYQTPIRRNNYKYTGCLQAANKQYVFGGNSGGKQYIQSNTLLGTSNAIVCNVNVGIVTGCLGTQAPANTTYYHVFFTPGVYQIVVPIGTTQIKVDALGGGATGNMGTNVSAPGYNTQIGTSAGGGSGGYVRSTLIKNFTMPGSSLIDVQVACRINCNSYITYKSSKVTIDGVLEAEAYSAYDVRGGGEFVNLGTGWGNNYARNGITRLGARGGQGYFSGTTYRGGGGGGAPWYGGSGGAGGAAISTRPSGGGGGAAGESAGGNSGVCSGSTTVGGSGGSSAWTCSRAGTANFTAGLCCRRNGFNGAGGAGGSTTCSTTRRPTGGNGGNASAVTGAATFAFNNYDGSFSCTFAAASIGAPFGPGGGGGGSYATGTSTAAYKNGVAAGYFGAGGGGGTSGGVGSNGLVIVTLTIDTALAAASARITTSTSHTEIID